MRLSAYAVVLVLHPGVLEETERMFGGLGWTCKHEADGMEQAHFCIGQLAFGGEPESFADISKEHVGTLNFRQFCAERLGDCFFDQAFFQPDSEIAGHDLDDVLGFERRDFAQQFTN